LLGGFTRFSEAFLGRFRRTGFLYLGMILLYGLDIYLTVLLASTGRFVEGNPVNAAFLQDYGLQTWVVFRSAAGAGITLLFAGAFALAQFRHRRPLRRLDNVEELTVGTVTLFYAFAFVHNSLPLAALRP